MNTSCPFSAQACPFRRLPPQLRRVRVAAEPPKVDDTESRLEAYEKRAKSRKGEDVQKNEARLKAQAEAEASQVVWPEGQLLPDGWDKMDGFQKLTQLYMGERGLLFWANKVAFASVFVMGGLWIAFRFIGPALGLYELTDVLPPAY